MQTLQTLIKFKFWQCDVKTSITSLLGDDAEDGCCPPLLYCSTALQTGVHWTDWLTLGCEFRPVISQAGQSHLNFHPCLYYFSTDSLTLQIFTWQF